MRRQDQAQKTCLANPDLDIVPTSTKKSHMTSQISARGPLTPYPLAAPALLVMLVCAGRDDSTTAPGAPIIGAASAGDASVGIALIAQALLAAEAGFINGITLSINGGAYLS